MLFNKQDYLIGALLVLAMVGFSPALADTQVTTWGGPGGDIAASPDYEVTVKSGAKTWKPFTYHSYARAVDKLLDVEGKYIKLSFLALHSSEFKRPEDNKDTYALRGPASILPVGRFRLKSRLSDL